MPLGFWMWLCMNFTRVAFPSKSLVFIYTNNTHYLQARQLCSIVSNEASCVFISTEQALQRHLNRLPEPPMIRENLKKEIKMFVEMLHQRTREEGRYTRVIAIYFLITVQLTECEATWKKLFLIVESVGEKVSITSNTKTVF